MTANSKALVARDDIKELAERIEVILPGGKDIPLQVRLGVAQLALFHGLDPFLGEIMPIKTKRGWVPYVGIDGHRRSARQQIQYDRVLMPLTDHWADEYYKMTAQEVRQFNGLSDKDIVWICALYVDGRNHPFVELGVCGPSFTTISKAPQFKIAKKRAEMAALKAACDLPFGGGYVNEAAEAVVEEPPIEGQVTVLPQELPTEPDGHEPVESEPERSEADFYAEARIEADFLAAVCTKIPYFNHANHVGHVLANLGLEWSWEQEPALWDVLSDYARKRADEKAAADEGKLL